MNSMILTIIILSVVGVLSGLILSIASIIMAVKKDETAEKIEEVLPGANCGACGFSGCSGYAAALASKETDNTALCAPGGADASAKIAEILGVDAGAFIQKRAVVRCRGNSDVTTTVFDYNGAMSCAAANKLYGGAGACKYGCIGYGDCVSACDFGAVKVVNGVAAVDESLCGGCGKCAKACPKNIIEMVSGYDAMTVLCQNHDKGAQTRKVCTAGCIGCMMCVKACEQGAVKVESFCAHIDSQKCIGCGKCADVCPQKCII